eukprot:TRINITY_DN2175_c1_g1_i2.p1 TRINITY_DN2175_c1_g1~~TRINITY_DN2175_c1_g1_i2.p1  ORF type:complete len:406 (+),score=77.75 TRINITY_DN2175_c1_g1_i2:180-1397(+)
MAIFTSADLYEEIADAKRLGVLGFFLAESPEESELMDLLLMELASIHNIFHFELTLNSSFNMTKRQYNLFMDYLQSSSIHLRHLDLIDVVRSIEDMQQLMDALSDHCCLHHLGLQMGDLSDEGAILLAELMSSLPSLLSVTYRFQMMSSLGVQTIFSAVESNPHKSHYELDFHYNSVTWIDGKLIGGLRNVAALNLEYNDLNPRDVISLCDSLKNNKSTALKRLHIGYVKKAIPANVSELPKAIGELLRNNSTLEELDIRSGYADSYSSTTDFIEALEFNTSLKDVRFVGQDFNDKTLELLIAKLKHNRSIQRIYIDPDTDITGYGATILWYHMLQSPIKFFVLAFKDIEEHLKAVVKRANSRLLVDLCCSTISSSRELLDNAKGVIPDDLYSICEAFHKHYSSK